jgi:hypothetical protein
VGLTKVTVKVSSITKSGKPVEADFLVDTGAIDCMAPAKMLKDTGIDVEGKAVYELASETPIEYKLFR